MKLRDRLLALLGSPDYTPVDERALGVQLGLDKKTRKGLAHEVRLLLSSGAVVFVKGDRLSLAGEEDSIRGRIQFRSGGWAQVVSEDHPNSDAIQIAPEDTHVALHGDRVTVKVFSQLSRRRDGRGHERTGRVTRVLTRARETIVGQLQKIRSVFYVTPDEPRLVHDVYVADPATSSLTPPPVPGDKVVVALDDWTERHRRLEGRIVERLGRTFEPRAELLGVFRKFNLDTQFPAEVEREAASIPPQVGGRDLVGRLDYRDTPCFTIDPDDAKDFDDALSLEFLEDDGVKVGVHIADVAAYARHGTALDKEAQRRGNSTYLVGTVIPMLPEKLSNGVCSLVEAQDRLCKAVFLSFDAKGRLLETDFANTVIRSRKRLTYKQAYAFLFAKSLDEIRALPLPPKHQTGSTGRALSSLTDGELVDLQAWVRKLWSIARKLRQDRMRQGSLDLDMPETKVFVDAQGYADRLEKIEHDESHQLIEEFMLAANEAVARLTRLQKLPSLYRVHDEPDEDKLSEYQNFLGTFQVQAGDLTQRKAMSSLLATLAEHPQGYTLRTQLLRSLKKAAYRASPDGHYGLAKKDYTHFTSPIRRYSDLVVHRVLDAYFVKHQDYRPPQPVPSYGLGQLESLGEHLSLTEINSAEAERESVKIKLLEFFERQLTLSPPPRFAAVITDVRGNGLFVELVESMTFGFLPTAALEGDAYLLDAGGTSFTGRRTQRRLAVGTHIEVHIGKVDRLKRLIDFRLAPASDERGVFVPKSKSPGARRSPGGRRPS